MVAEVIASNTREVEAEMYPDRDVPAFGSWVQIERVDGTVLYGLVSHVEQGSVEPNRRATALNMSRDELRAEMPQVLELVRTLVRAQILLHRRPDGVLRQTVPPHPADLHDRVHACAQDVVADFTAPYDYLRTLARHPDPAVPADDLLVAVLGQIYRAHGSGQVAREELVAAGRALSRLLNDDHERLHSILRRVQ